MALCPPAVTIEQGTLHGSTGVDIKGNTFFKFQGIPYAKPPIGNLRFKAPQPPEKWTGILDASKEGDVCIHRNPLKDWEVVKGGEDCLFLNVYTNKLYEAGKDLRPVMFWMHGGGFVFGSGNEEFYGPHFLLTEDVVLVTINYRLGLLGFINFDDPTLDVPGNAGFKDQVMALKWVQKNIKQFGGDPSNVTIFGESAGGASAHLLMLSPLTKGLFHRVISQSGCALNPWASGSNGSKTLAKAIGMEGADEKTIYKTLLHKPIDELFEVQDLMADNFEPNKRRDFGWIVEKNSKEPFLDDEPLNIILAGKFNQVPFLTGYTSSEGMCFDVVKPPNLPDEVNFENIIPWTFGYQLGTKETKALADKLQYYYFGNIQNETELTTKKYDILTDCQFLWPAYVMLLSQSRVSKAPTYFYRMSVETNLNVFKAFGNIQLPGVSHGDDLGYIFKHFATPEIKPGSAEEIALTKVVKLWTNFAKFGNPTPQKNDKVLNVEWKPFTGQNLEYLDLGQVLEMKSKPDFERIQFWKSLFTECPAGQKPECVHLTK